MASRRNQRANAINKRIKMRRRGKFNMKQIMEDRSRSPAMAEERTHLRLQHEGPDTVTVKAHIEHANPVFGRKFRKKEAERQFINSGPVQAMSMHGHRLRTGGRIFRNKKGHIFVVEDRLDEYLAVAFEMKQLSDEELLNLGQPDEEGWKTTNPYPLSEVKRKLLTMKNEPEKWQHFNIAKMSTLVLDLFFSPKKDAWFYVRLNPETGKAERSQVYPNKYFAEQRRLSKTWKWYTLSNPIKL